MVFRNSVEPAFCVTFDADITNLLQQIKKQNFSFTLAFVYVVCKCANEMEAFRYRFLDDNIVIKSFPIWRLIMCCILLIMQTKRII